MINENVRLKLILKLLKHKWVHIFQGAIIHIVILSTTSAPHHHHHTLYTNEIKSNKSSKTKNKSLDGEGKYWLLYWPTINFSISFFRLLMKNGNRVQVWPNAQRHRENKRDGFHPQEHQGEWGFRAAIMGCRSEDGPWAVSMHALRK